MKAFVACLGTGGDLNPYLALGRALAAREHEVIILADAGKRAQAQAAGLDFSEVQSVADWDRFIAHPGLWQRDVSMRTLYQLLFLPTLLPVYQAVLRQFQPGNTVLIGNTGAIGLKMAQEKLRAPLVHVLLTPYQLHRETRATNSLEEQELRVHIDSVRRTLRLAPVSGSLVDWFYAADRTIAAYPSWFGAGEDLDGFTAIEHAGFVLRGPAVAVDDTWHEFVDGGGAPIVFTAGTGMRHSADFFAASLEVCRALDIRGVFLTRYPDQVPPALPDTVFVSSYIPLEELLPRSRGIVHHGGIGTCAQALRAGVPQLVMPMAFDQFVNARQLERLGVGLTIERESLGGSAFADKLASVLDARRVRAARDVAARFTDEDAADSIADAIERDWRVWSAAA